MKTDNFKTVASLQDSDLDVFVDIGGMYSGTMNQDARIQEKIVMTACKLFRRDKVRFSLVNPIATARTPIVQVYHAITNLDCDLSFRHGLSVENSKFLRYEPQILRKNSSCISYTEIYS